jgi:hypothetical protein
MGPQEMRKHPQFGMIIRRKMVFMSYDIIGRKYLWLADRRSGTGRHPDSSVMINVARAMPVDRLPTVRLRGSRDIE